MNRQERRARRFRRQVNIAKLASGCIKSGHIDAFAHLAGIRAEIDEKLFGRHDPSGEKENQHDGTPEQPSKTRTVRLLHGEKKTRVRIGRQARCVILQTLHLEVAMHPNGDRIIDKSRRVSLRDDDSLASAQRRAPTLVCEHRSESWNRERWRHRRLSKRGRRFPGRCDGRTWLRLKAPRSGR
jgi:hypothetical protein